MSKLTAVDWLVKQIEENHNFRFGNFYWAEIQQALAMEREQIIDAVSKGFDNCEEGKVRWLGEQYYNETYKGGEQ